MKKLIAILMAVILMLTLTACGNYTIFDTTYHYNRAIIKLPTGEIVEGEVDSWCDYDGDQVQIEIDDVIYLVHINNATLIAE